MRKKNPGVKMTTEAALNALPHRPNGSRVTFKKEPKKDKIKKLLGDKVKGMIISGDEITLLMDEALSSSDREKVQKIMDGE